MHDPIVIVEALRTPIGSFRGELSRLSSIELGTVVVRGLLSLTSLDPSKVEELIMGCVLPAGLRQAPARQVALKAGLSIHTPATTLNKVCGSGLKAVISAYTQLLAGEGSLFVAGGMESMTNAPLLTKRPPKGENPESVPYADHLFLDGLEDAYQKGTAMGVFAEATAEKYGFTRAQQDAFAQESVTRAKSATENKWFRREIIPLVIKTPEQVIEVSEDEGVKRSNLEKIALLRPVFKSEGTITAASSSGIADGAAALIVARGTTAKELGLTIRARIVGYASHAQAPEWFTTAPIEAIRKLLQKTGWEKEDVDLFEINEAFAVVVMAAQQELALDSAKVNIHGGACALGHPIGASGARILVTLLNALERTQGKKGIAAICIGGGEALAFAIERE